jgi:CheY-like chemotaxis protein
VFEPDQYHDCVRLSESERSEVLRRLESNTDLQAQAKRRDARHEYRGHNVHLDLHTDGGRVARFLTFSRDLSASGLSLIHGGFVYPGTICQVTLTTLEGDTETIEGVVKRCDYVKGMLHELGIRFDRRIDPKQFAASAGEALSERTMEALAARDERILFLDDSEAELTLFRHHMRATGFDVATARDAKEACEQIGASGVALFVCDLDLGPKQRSGEEVIQLARGAGFSRPILALTGQSAIERIRLAKQNGASTVLLKPYSPARLLETVASLLDADAEADAA